MLGLLLVLCFWLNGDWVTVSVFSPEKTALRPVVGGGGWPNHDLPIVNFQCHQYGHASVVTQLNIY